MEAILRGSADTRELPLYRAGEHSYDVRAFGHDEVLDRETVWGDHAHPTHELIWHESGAGVVKVGRRLWTVAGTVALWIPAGLVHSGRAHARSRQRTVHFAVDTPPLGKGPVAVELTPLLALLVDRLAQDGLAEESRELTERLILDVIRPSSRGLVLDVPTSPLIEPIVEALRDDPSDQTTFLDVSHQVEVLDLLTDLNETSGITVIMVLHDLNLAARYCDQVVMIADGGVEAVGAPSEIFTEERVSRVFGLRSRIIDDPVSGTPLVLPIGRHRVL